MENEQEYEIIMLKGDAIVDGSRQKTRDKEIIKLSYEYALHKGYRFSSRKVNS